MGNVNIKAFFAKKLGIKGRTGSRRSPKKPHRNLYLQDVLEAICDDDKSKVFCSEHRGKECFMACLDCYEPLCKVCLKLLMRGPHREHDIEGIQETNVIIKQRLRDHLENRVTTTEAEVELTRSNTEEHDDETSLSTVTSIWDDAINLEALDDETSTVSSMSDDAVNMWKMDCIAKRELELKRQAEECDALKSSQRKMPNMSNFGAVARAVTGVLKERKVDIPCDLTLQVEQINMLHETSNSTFDSFCEADSVEWN